MKTLDELNALLPKTLMGHLAIRFTEVKEGMIVAEMPVDERTVQPFGRLHGGASVALAESVASAGSWALLKDENTAVYATEVSASHVGAALSGTTVTAKGILLIDGKRQHIWEVIVYSQTGKMVSVCRITNSLVTLH
jgi:1,4-dihydroxy-2-naphthoyl-CoA hydrolase